MSWNDCLYWYSQARGGTFFALREEGTDGVLLLEDPKGPILIATRVTGSGQHVTYRDAVVSMRLELERPYALRIKPESAVGEGLRAALGQLDRGAKALGVKARLHRDYGAPELAAARGIKSDDPEFTKWVLNSRELREALAQNPRFGVQVGPSGPEGRDHLVCAHASLENGAIRLAGEEWTDEGRIDQVKERYQICGFQESLDALVQLAKTARAAVTAWPMPYQGEERR